MEDNIKIALYGQFGNDTGVEFTYPDKFDTAHHSQRDEWLRSVTEPRDARVFIRPTEERRSFNIERIYALWSNRLGNYYATIVPYIKDARNGFAMVALFVGRQLPESGRAVVSLLQNLEALLVKEGVRNVNAIDDAVANFRTLLTPDPTSLPMEGTPQVKAFRIYKSDLELEEIFLNPHQQAYSTFNRVLLVPQSAALQGQASGYTELTNVICRTYKVECPQNVQADKRYVTDGDKLSITYRKTGYPDVTVSATVAIQSKHFVVNGNSLVLNSAEVAGIGFERKVKFDVRSSETHNPIQSFSVGGRYGYTNGTEYTLDGDGRNGYYFDVDANYYQKTRITKTIEQLAHNNWTVEVELKPEEKSSKLTILFDNQQITGNVKIAHADPLYKYVTGSQNYEWKVAPKRYGGGEGTQKSGSKWKYIFSGLLVGLLLGVLLKPMYNLLNEEQQQPTTGQMAFTNEAQQTPADTPDTPSGQQEQIDSGSPFDSFNEAQQQQASLENHDIKYLKKEDIWFKDSIKSEKYKNLYYCLEDGNIIGILNNIYNQANEKNGFWVSIKDNLESIKSDQGKNLRAKEELKRLANSGKCDMNKLASAIKQIANPTAQQRNQQQDNRQGGSRNQSNTGANENGGSNSTEGRPDPLNWQ